MFRREQPDHPSGDEALLSRLSSGTETEHAGGVVDGREERDADQPVGPGGARCHYPASNRMTRTRCFRRNPSKDDRGVTVVRRVAAVLDEMRIVTHDTYSCPYFYRPEALESGDRFFRL